MVDFSGGDGEAIGYELDAGMSNLYGGELPIGDEAIDVVEGGDGLVMFDGNPVLTDGFLEREAADANDESFGDGEFPVGPDDVTVWQLDIE